MSFPSEKHCKYCKAAVVDITDEGLYCKTCLQYVHINCLKRKCVPGGILGDIFFTFECAECSPSGSEAFQRDKITWLQAIAIALYDLQGKSPGLARNGYFHWKIHIASYIDKYWDVLFRKEFKRKKKWMGTISGSLSTYSPHFFRSGTSLFTEQGWWTLSYPKLTPNCIFQINAKMMLEKQKLKEENKYLSELERLQQILLEKGYYTEDELEQIAYRLTETQEQADSKAVVTNTINVLNLERKHPTKTLLPTLERYGELPRKLMKYNDASLGISETNKSEDNKLPQIPSQNTKMKTLLDPMCHYNTSLRNITSLRGEQFRTKLLGGLREDLLQSPYSGLYLKPYIRRDTKIFPNWLKLMAEIQLAANENETDFVLPPRGPLDFVYVQPEHVPAVNSLCNQFFWPGIDLTECLQYPDYSCVVLYRKLVVGFAFVVPDVKVSENYISFLFTRPHWRNCGIAKYMLYHLIQTSLGKDLTLHVSVNNSALFLYQKFGFKVEHVALDFYDKYIRQDAKESKHAFFCRLER